LSLLVLCYRCHFIPRLRFVVHNKKVMWVPCIICLSCLAKLRFPFKINNENGIIRSFWVRVKFQYEPGLFQYYVTYVRLSKISGYKLLKAFKHFEKGRKTKAAIVGYPYLLVAASSKNPIFPKSYLLDRYQEGISNPF